MKEQNNQENRNSFIDWINERMTELEFVKEPEREKWFFERDVQTSTQTLIVNGRRMDQPGETHHLRFEVNVYGDGGMKDFGNETVSPFVEVNFNVFQDGNDMTEWPTFCMFYDDQELFETLLGKIFRI